MAAKPGKKRRRRRTERPPEVAAPELDAFDGTGTIGPGDRRNLAVVVVTALCVRVVFFLLHKQNDPLFNHPIMDALYHHEWAVEILSGNFWGDEVFFRAPLYPYFLALLYKISGSSIAFAVFIQHLIGTGSALLVYLLARQFFVPRIALLAGILAALYWPLIYFEGDLLIVTLIVLLDLLALLLIVKSLRRPTVGLLVASGVVLGLSAVARPSILILFAVLPVVFYLQRPEPGRAAARLWARRTALVYAGAAIVIAPVIVRNYVVGHDFVPIASQGGVNFYIGNNPRSDGRTAIVPGTRWDWWGGFEDAVRIAETARGRPLKPSEVSSYYFRKGFEFIFTSPAESIPLLTKKLYLFWAGGERSNNKYIYFFWHRSGMGKVPLPGFWLVAPLGLLGGVLLWSRRRELSLLYLFVVTYTLGVVAFFVNARFRLPVVPVLIVFSAYAVFYLWHHLRKRSPQTWKAAVLLVLFVLVVDLDFIRFRENKVHADSLSHYTLGNAYLKMGDKDRAISEYEEALAVYRKYPVAGYRLIARNVDYNLGRLYSGKGLCSRAVVFLERVGGDDRFAMLAKESLAHCYLELGRFRDAAEVYSQIVAAVPDHGEARRGLADALLGQARIHKSEGDTRRARELLIRAQSLVPDDEAIAREIESLRADR